MNLNLRELRSKKGLTQDQLAKLIGRTRQTIINWEKDFTVPDQHELAIMSKIFDNEVKKSTIVPHEADSLRIVYERRLEEKERIILTQETTIFVQTDRIKELKEINNELKERLKSLQQSQTNLVSAPPRQ